MLASAKIIIAGLCTLLNPRNDYATKNASELLPEPSVIFVNTGANFGRTAKHVPYIAWNRTHATATLNGDPFVGEEVFGQPDWRFLRMKGEIVIADDKKPAPPDASELIGVASYLRYARDRASTKWNRCYIPEPNQLPDKKCVAGFMRFGGGTLTAGRPTLDKFAFEDDQGPTTPEMNFARRVTYSTDPTGNTGGKQYLDLALRELDDAMGTTDRKFRFTAVNPNTDVVIFMGNTIEDKIEHDLVGDHQGTALRSSHFHALARAVLDETDMPIPVRKPVEPPSTPGSHGAGGDDTGYCGPDSKP